MPHVRLLAAVLAVAAGAPPCLWLTNLDAARSLADEAGMPVLAVFTAPDWSPACATLDERVLGTKAFAEWATGRFVTCRLDYTAAGGPSKDLQRVAERYRIAGFPTLALLEADGTLLAKLPYRSEQAHACCTRLDEAFAACRHALTRLDALPTLPPDRRRSEAALLFRHAFDALGARYLDAAAALFAADPDDTTGLRGDAAYLLCDSTNPLAAEAETYLEAMSPRDPQHRYGHLLFTRTTAALHALLAAAHRAGSSPRSSPEVRTAAVRLFKQLKRARPFLGHDELATAALMRAALALAYGGRPERARSLVERARRLGAPAAALQGFEQAIDGAR